MPLPLPNLDTRRWEDLVEEGRALIPRYAAGWTDHNVHDPGITLIELFAYLVEGLLYRANRIPERHRRKFMALAGFFPRPPRPACGLVQARLVSGTTRLDLPAGTILAAPTEQGSVRFTLVRETTFLEARLRAVQVFDGAEFTDRTRPALGRVPFPAFGPDPAVSGQDPERHPAMYLGFDRPLLPGATVSLAFQWQEARDGEDVAIRTEAEAQADCHQPRPDYPCHPCAPEPWCGRLARGDEATASPAAAGPALEHHSARVVWEYRALDQWHRLAADDGAIEDPTRSLTLDGVVRVRVPGPMTAIAVGVLPEALYWIRCRFAAGAFDDAPTLIGPLENAAAIVQQVPCWRRYEVAPAAVMAPPPLAVPGPVELAFDDEGRLTRLGPAPADGRPEVQVLEFAPPTATSPWIVTLALEHLLSGSGEPGQAGGCEQPQVADGMVDVIALEPSGWQRWEMRADLDASGPHDRHYTLDPTEGDIRFGDGVRGRVVSDAVDVLARYATTHAGDGNVREGLSWDIEDDPWNRALLATTSLSVPAANARLLSLHNPAAARGGAERETLESLERRAAETLWAHERLIQLLPAVEPATLDQTDPSAVRARPAPDRATTTADYERLAIEVPGTRVRRVRAWANLDPNFPNLDAAGTVTVVVVPALPRGRPQPSRGLLRAVRRFLDRRRVLGTRLLVVGPDYLTVEVTVRVRAYRNADAGGVRTRVDGALREFLDPLRGGPAGLGWPFGRDVFRSEIMAVIDGVAGVDHVLECTLSGNGATARCDNLCVPPTWLVASGTHTIEVERP